MNLFKDQTGTPCFLRIPIRDGVCEAPVYESHARGKNWTAIVNRDVSAPHGLDRQFLKTVRNRQYFYPNELGDDSLFGEDVKFSIKAGDVIEWGADYYTGSGHKVHNRKYAAVISVSDTMLIVSTLYEGPGRAFKHAEDIRQTIAEEHAADQYLLAELASDVIMAQSLTGPERAVADSLLTLEPDRRRLVAEAAGLAVK